MILRHREFGDKSTEYTMALDKVEFIAIQIAVFNALQLIKESGVESGVSGIDLAVIYGVLDLELKHPKEVA